MNEVVKGVAQALRVAFPGAAVYDEAVEMGLKRPGFSVRIVGAKEELFRGLRYWKTHTVNVVYFPAGEERNGECIAVKEALFSALEYVRVGGDLVRGTRMEGHVEDGVLSFVVGYDWFAYRAEDEEQGAEVMEELRAEVRGA